VALSQFNELAMALCRLDDGRPRSSNVGPMMGQANHASVLYHLRATAEKTGLTKRVDSTLSEAFLR
jgi:hypothetical protein